MLQITDITYSVEGRPLFEAASATIPYGHKVGLVGRNGTGKTTLFRLIRGELALEGGEISLPAALAHRRRRAGGAVVGDLAARHGAGRPTPNAPRCWPRPKRRTDPHRIAEIQHRLTDIDAWSAEGRASRHPQGPGLRRRGAAAPLLGLLGRLADAGGAGGGALRPARPAAAGRADQLPRSRRRALAGKLSGEVSPHRPHHQPRPRPSEPRRAGHPASRRAQADLLDRPL